MEKELEKKIEVETLMASFVSLDSIKLRVQSQLMTCSDSKSEYDRGVCSAYVSVIDAIDADLLKIREKLRKRYNVTVCTKVAEVVL